IKTDSTSGANETRKGFSSVSVPATVSGRSRGSSAILLAPDRKVLRETVLSNITKTRLYVRGTEYDGKMIFGPSNLHISLKFSSYQEVSM
ncbi:unnamed protein product, partial [Nesidiocoris tenuis]